MKSLPIRSSTEGPPASRPASAPMRRPNLATLLIARGLAASGEAKTKNLNVVAYNPGLTIGTLPVPGLAIMARLAMGVVSLVRPFARMNTVDISGRTLAELALERITPPPGRIYASLNSRKLELARPVQTRAAR